MSLMGEKRFCVICDKDVEIDKVIPHEDYDEQILSCGHFGRRINISIPPEKVSIGGNLDANVIKYRSLVEGPLLVTGASGTSVTSGTYEASFIKGNLVNSNVTINQNKYNYELNMNTAINNLTIQNVLSNEDSNNTYTPEEKETAKDTLTKVTELIASTGSAAGKVALFLPLLAKIFQ